MTVIEDRPTVLPSHTVRCVYCGGSDTVTQCCPAHPQSGMCRWCRAVKARPAFHRSPLEGRACCGTVKVRNAQCVTCRAIK